MKKAPTGIVVAALCGSSLIAADPKDLWSAKSFWVEANPQMPGPQTAFNHDVPQKTSRGSKSKIAWIALGAGAAVVTGFVLANRGGGNSSRVGASPQPGAIGSIVVINGVPQ